MFSYVVVSVIIAIVIAIVIIDVIILSSINELPLSLSLHVLHLGWHYSYGDLIAISPTIVSDKLFFCLFD